MEITTMWGSLRLAPIIQRKCLVEVTSVGLAHARPIIRRCHYTAYRYDNITCTNAHITSLIA